MTQRLSDFVPYGAWHVLIELSKTDLCELLWDFAIQAYGNDRSTDQLLGAIARQHAEFVGRGLQRKHHELLCWAEKAPS